MSLLNKFQALNNFIYDKNYYELICDGCKIGYVHREIAKDIIINTEGLFLLDHKIYFKYKDKTRLNRTVSNISKVLIKKKIAFKPSDEYFSCRPTVDGKEFFKLDRKLLEFLGIRGYGVHLIAYLKYKNSYKLWVPKRNKDKLVEPSKLDNTVAGGVKKGEDIFSALEREAHEEAGLTRHDLKNVKLVGTLNYNWKNTQYTIRRDTLYLFDLEVDKSFKPNCLDGEVGEFKLMDWKKVLHLIQNTNLVKNNCNLVFFNFMIRHGLITHENEKDYEAILML